MEQSITSEQAAVLGKEVEHHLAWKMLHGIGGVAKDSKAAFNLAWKGYRLQGCPHCQGVAAMCLRLQIERPRYPTEWQDLARESSGSGSKYGQYVLGQLYEHGGRGVAKDDVQAVALYRLAAEQDLDEAQFSLGIMYSLGYGVDENEAEALRCFQLAAAQGHHQALCQVAVSHDFGIGVPVNKDEAIRLYKLAQAAGSKAAANHLRRLCAE